MENLSHSEGANGTVLDMGRNGPACHVGMGIVRSTPSTGKEHMVSIAIQLCGNILSLIQEVGLDSDPNFGKVPPNVIFNSLHLRIVIADDEVQFGGNAVRHGGEI